MPYTGPPTPPEWGQASGVAHLVAILEEGGEPVWPPCNAVVEEPTLASTRNAEGLTKYEFMLWKMTAGIPMADRANVDQDAIKAILDKHRPADHADLAG